MKYVATWKAHGTTYESGRHDTLEACELDVFGRAYAPLPNCVRFWQVDNNAEIERESE